MTRDEILNMPAGREMDAIIAEKVIGMKWYAWNDNTFGTIRGLRPENKFSYAVMTFYEGATVEYPDLKAYSTDIAAAWEVVGKMTWFEIEKHIENHKAHWACTYETADTIDCVEADSAPLAICRAALLAMINP